MVVITNSGLSKYLIRKHDAYLSENIWSSFQAAVNESDSTITVESGQLAGCMSISWSEGEREEYPMYVDVVEMDKDANDNRTVRALPEIKGKIAPDGSVSFPEDCFIGFEPEPAKDIWDMLDISTYSRPNVFEAIPELVPDLNDYERIGEASFTDGWFNPKVRMSGGSEVKDVKVPLWSKKGNRDELLLENPYIDRQWKENGIQKGNGEGFIVLDVSDPSFVKVLPLVKCGMQTEIMEDGTPIDFYLFTYLQWIFRRGEDNLYKAKSSFLAGNKITIEEPVFGTEECPMYEYVWVNTPDHNSSIIELPQDWSGSIGVASEPTSESCFYNLQGIRLTHPVKGQPVIEVRGGMVRKVME